MPENDSPDRRPSSKNSKDASSKRAGASEKRGRVSQRRELAAVTLGAVAAITGLGGVLAANPPSWAASAANPQPAITTQAPAASSQYTPIQTRQQAAQQQAARQAAPAYSAPTQAPAAAVSQGS